MDTPSKRLLAKLDLAYPVFGRAAQRIWNSAAIRELYPVYLRTMHMIVRSAVPLMQCAVERARERGGRSGRGGDRLAEAVARYFARHLEEEAGHDAWLLEDLAATGGDPAEAEAQVPSPRVAALVGAQYYWIRHYHPVSLLGHIAAIESYHPPVGFAARLRGLTGYPAQAFRSIARHEVLDVRHKRELHEVIDRLPLEPRHEKAIGLSALHTMQAGIEVLAEIADSVVHRPAGVEG